MVLGTRACGAVGAVGWRAMLRRWVMIASTMLFVLTCAVAVWSLHRPPIGIVRVTEDVQADGRMVGQEFSGAVFDNASIAVGRWGWHDMDLSIPPYTSVVSSMK